MECVMRECESEFTCVNSCNLPCNIFSWSIKLCVWGHFCSFMWYQSHGDAVRMRFQLYQVVENSTPLKWSAKVWYEICKKKIMMFTEGIFLGHHIERPEVSSDTQLYWSSKKITGQITGVYTRKLILTFSHYTFHSK